MTLAGLVKLTEREGRDAGEMGIFGGFAWIFLGIWLLFGGGWLELEQYN